MASRTGPLARQVAASVWTKQVPRWATGKVTTCQVPSSFIAVGRSTQLRTAGTHCVVGLKAPGRNCHLRFGVSSRVQGVRRTSTEAGVSQEAAASDTAAGSPRPSTEQIKGRILRDALENVHTHGWTSAALQQAATAQGFPVVTASIFPRGAAHVFEHLVANLNDNMANQLAEADLDGMSEEDVLFKALSERLLMMEPYIKSWPEALSVAAMPQNLPHALEHLALLADEAWFYAGDTSQGLTFHVKRLLLAGAYASSELVMTQDTSAEFSETISFLRNRIKDVLAFQSGPLGPLSLLTARDQMLSPKDLPEKVKNKLQDANLLAGSVFKTASTVVTAMTSPRQKTPSSTPRREHETEPVTPATHRATYDVTDAPDRNGH